MANPLHAAAVEPGDARPFAVAGLRAKSIKVESTLIVNFALTP
jgi:hypothetical protein